MATPREIALWVTVGVLAALVLSSFTGMGTGLFGWGWMMGMMWLWMLLPVALIVLLAVMLTDEQRGRDENQS